MKTEKKCRFVAAGRDSEGAVIVTYFDESTTSSVARKRLRSIVKSAEFGKDGLKTIVLSENGEDTDIYGCLA